VKQDNTDKREFLWHFLNFTLLKFCHYRLDLEADWIPLSWRKRYSKSLYEPSYITLFISSSLQCVYFNSKIYSNRPLPLTDSASTSNEGYGDPIQLILSSLLLTHCYLSLNPFLPRCHLAHEYQPMAFTFHIEFATLSVNNALFNCFYTRMHSPSQKYTRVAMATASAIKCYCLNTGFRYF
jgi:hypothetical protein